jgi:hypothetical protein
MKAPPHELAQLDNLYAGLDGDLLNLSLPFGDRGPKTWPEPARRHWLAKFAIEAWDRDLPQFRTIRDRVR